MLAEFQRQFAPTEDGETPLALEVRGQATGPHLLLADLNTVLATGTLSATVALGDLTGVAASRATVEEAGL